MINRQPDDGTPIRRRMIDLYDLNNALSIVKVKLLTLTNCTTVRSLNSIFDKDIASTVGSILIVLILAISLSKCRHVGA